MIKYLEKDLNTENSSEAIEMNKFPHELWIERYGFITISNFLIPEICDLRYKSFHSKLLIFPRLKFVLGTEFGDCILTCIES